MSLLTEWDKIQPPATIEELTRAIGNRENNMFHCMVGPPRAYFELLTGICANGWPDTQQLIARFVYVVLAWKTPVADDAEKVLTQRLWRQMIRARKAFDPQDTPCLFWRRMPEYRVETTTSDDHGNVIALQPEDRVAIASMRLVVPGYHFLPHEVKVEGVAPRTVERA